MDGRLLPSPCCFDCRHPDCLPAGFAFFTPKQPSIQGLTTLGGRSVCGRGERTRGREDLSEVTIDRRHLFRENHLRQSVGPFQTLLTVHAIKTRLSQGFNQRIAEAIPKIEISVSSYDTAWVAMVSSPDSPQRPYFPECLEWILENQLPDGSWPLPCNSFFFMKDALSSTLACVIALKRWNVGREHRHKGVHYITSNFSYATDERQHFPVGFNIIFPGMIEYAKELDINFPISESTLSDLFHMRDIELKRGFESNSRVWKAYLAYVSEGLGHNQDWEGVMEHQRNNGSLFNSPSTTAAALAHIWDAKALHYLQSVLHKFENAVPAVYPTDIYTNLCVVDSLEKLGIAHHFGDCINEILYETYRKWLQGDEEIHSELATYAKAFRLLRMYGYDVSSDAFGQLDADEIVNSPMVSNWHSMGTVLELFRASQMNILQNETVMKKLNSWSSKVLRNYISRSVSHDELDKVIIQEVNYALKFPAYANLERLEHKENIENYNAQNVQILKSSYMFQNISDVDILKLAVEDFHTCQSLYQDELRLLERWVRECRLDQLKFARQKLTYCYFSAASTLFSPEMSDVRISWAKNSVLTTVIDDFFDVGGSREELVNLMQLVERWDANFDKYCLSNHVRIIFSALYTTITDLGERASARQGYNVTSHLIETWLKLIMSMMKETGWLSDGMVPTMDQYMNNGYVSFALGPIILPALYFVGPKLSWDIIRHAEYDNLYRLVSTCGRLLNDIQGFEREGRQGKLNSVSLRVVQGCGMISEEDAKSELRRIIDGSRTELLRLVLQNKGSVVPRACKDLFWKMSRILHLFYATNDGFTSPTEMMTAVNAVIHEPLKVPDREMNTKSE